MKRNYVRNIGDRKMVIRQLLALFAVWLLTAMPVLAALTGDLQGTVIDPKGATVEGAKISVRNPATGAVREVTSDSRGEFALLQLEVGIYEVRIEKAGFHTSLTNADIRSGEQTRLNLTLELGSVAESITVEGTTGPELDVSTAQTSNSFSSEVVQDLPNLGRDPLAYATL